MRRWRRGSNRSELQKRNGRDLLGCRPFSAENEHTGSFSGRYEPLDHIRVTARSRPFCSVSLFRKRQVLLRLLKESNEMNRINWKVRFKNKVWLGSFLSLIVGFVYSMLALFDVYPEVTQNHIVQLVNQVLTFLGLIGVIVDPTTAGLGDSERALEYTEPWDDNR